MAERETNVLDPGEVSGDDELLSIAIDPGRECTVFGYLDGEGSGNLYTTNQAALPSSIDTATSVPENDDPLATSFNRKLPAGITGVLFDATGAWVIRVTYAGTKQA